MKAVSREHAAKILPEMDTLIYIRDLGEDIEIPFLNSLRRIKIKSLIGYLDQIRVLLDTGYSQSEMINVLTKYGAKDIQFLASRMSSDIIEGHSLSQSFYDNKKIIGRDLSPQLRAGENNSTLSEVLVNITKQLESELDTKNKIRTALISPAIVLLVLLVSMVFTIIFVVPIMQTMLQDMGGDTPPAMQIIISISNFVTEHGIFTGCTTVISSLIIYLLIKYPLAVWWAGIIIKIPVLGDIVRMQATINFYRFLGFSLESGVPIQDGLVYSIDTVTNKRFQKDLKIVIERVIERAEELSLALQETDFVTSIDRQTISVGESSGTLAEQLLRMANVQEKELKDMTVKINELIQPTITVIMGILVGGMGLLMFGTVYGTIGAI